MQKLHTPQPALNELHPVELALLALMALAWAIATVARLVLVPLIGLLLVLTGWDRPRAAEPWRAPLDALEPCTPAAPRAPQAPAHHPLAALRDELALLTVRQLRQMAGAAARKNARKQELIEALLFCG